MCHILPVEHIPCKHTAIIYEHCIDAPKSNIDGRGPCPTIKKHARVILTRKLCAECGGPRFFARRGAIAERGWGTHASKHTSVEAEKADLSDANDSGYHSESRLDDRDEEEDEFHLSPKTSALNVKSWKYRIRQRDVENREKYRSSNNGRRPSWGPNLRQELSDESLSSRGNAPDYHRIPRSVPNGHPKTMSQRPKLAPLDVNCASQPIRKDSTLLHPSSLDERDSAIGAVPHSRPAFAFPISSKLKEKRPQPTRKSSTLLHPSTPPAEDELHLENATEFPFSSSSLSHNKNPRRKSSTLLHPSPPLDTDSISSQPLITTLPTPPPSSHSTSTPTLPLRSPNRPSAFSVPPRTQLSSPRPRLYRRSSILHSSMSDEEFDIDHSDHKTDNTNGQISLARKATIIRTRGVVNHIRIR